MVAVSAYMKLFLVCDKIGKRKLKPKKRQSQAKDIIHILITVTISGQQQTK